MSFYANYEHSAKWFTRRSIVGLHVCFFSDSCHLTDSMVAAPCHSSSLLVAGQTAGKVAIGVPVLPQLPFHMSHSSSRTTTICSRARLLSQVVTYTTGQQQLRYHSSSLLSPLSSSPSVRIFQAAPALPSVSAPILTSSFRTVWGEAMSGRHVPLQCMSQA